MLGQERDPSVQTQDVLRGLNFPVLWMSCVPPGGTWSSYYKKDRLDCSACPDPDKQQENGWMSTIWGGQNWLNLFVWCLISFSEVPAMSFTLHLPWVKIRWVLLAPSHPIDDAIISLSLLLLLHFSVRPPGPKAWWQNFKDFADIMHRVSEAAKWKP